MLCLQAKSTVPGHLTAAHCSASCSISTRLRSTPQRYPESRAVASDDAITGNRHRDLVRRAGLRHRAHRLRLPDAPSNFGVAHFLADRNSWSACHTRRWKAVRGTAFQQRVWQALRGIPAGKTASYAEVARRIGSPKAVRAVAQACGANNIAVAIPCHRVVKNDGVLSGYRWGVERKRALLEKEAKA